MLDDDAGRALVELLDTLQGRVRVGDVVVGEFLALDLGRGGDAGGAKPASVKKAAP